MNVRLRASDGHEFDAYVATPGGEVAKAVVVIQEIFGVNSHIRAVTDGFARDGFLAIAPALFDRAQRGIELGYDPAATQQGMGLVTKIGIEKALLDVAAALKHAQEQVGAARSGVVGYCLGGSLAWLAATRLDPAAAVGYYGGRIAQYAAEQPRCPVQLHFGAKDKHIPPAEIEKIRAAHAEVAIYVYDAGHGFNCDQRADYNPASSAVARQRTLEFLNQHLG
jgi:carboxymethylenebutenolidase